MNKKKIYLIIQSALCVVLAALLSIIAIKIFYDGTAAKADSPLEWIYSREKVASALIPVLPVIIIGFIMTVAGLILRLSDDKINKPVKDTEIQRNLIVSRIGNPNEKMKAERSKQKKIFIGGWAAFAVCMIPVLIYTINPAHFPEGQLEPVFIAFSAHTIPWIVIGITALMISTMLQEKSMKAEIEEAKKLGLGKQSGPFGMKGNSGSFKGVVILRAALLVIAAALIIAGIVNGSAQDVLGKAVNICTECVGLG